MGVQHRLRILRRLFRLVFPHCDSFKCPFRRRKDADASGSVQYSRDPAVFSVKCNLQTENILRAQQFFRCSPVNQAYSLLIRLRVSSAKQRISKHSLHLAAYLIDLYPGVLPGGLFSQCTLSPVSPHRRAGELLPVSTLKKSLKLFPLDRSGRVRHGKIVRECPEHTQMRRRPG